MSVVQTDGADWDGADSVCGADCWYRLGGGAGRLGWSVVRADGVGDGQDNVTKPLPADRPCSGSGRGTGLFAAAAAAAAGGPRHATLHWRASALLSRQCSLCHVGALYGNVVKCKQCIHLCVHVRDCVVLVC